MRWFVYGYGVRKRLFWGTRVRGKQRVIMLHPVASGYFTKPDTGGQEGGRARRAGGGEQTLVTVILWCLQIHTHRHTHA